MIKIIFLNLLINLTSLKVPFFRNIYTYLYEYIYFVIDINTYVNCNNKIKFYHLI